MEQVQVFKCPRTGRLFETIEKYNKYLAKNELKFKMDDLSESFPMEYDNVKDQPRLEATSVNEFTDSWKILINTLFKDFPNELLEIKLTNLRINGPTGNIQILGRGHFTFENNTFDCYAVDLLPIIYNLPGWKVGSGGGRGRELSYDVIFKLEDFPKMKEIYDEYNRLTEENAEFLNNLNNEVYKEFSENSEVKLIDSDIANIDNMICELKDKIIKLRRRLTDITLETFDSKLSTASFKDKDKLDEYKLKYSNII